MPYLSLSLRVPIHRATSWNSFAIFFLLTICISWVGSVPDLLLKVKSNYGVALRPGYVEKSSRTMPKKVLFLWCVFEQQRQLATVMLVCVRRIKIFKYLLVKFVVPVIYLYLRVLRFLIRRFLCVQDRRPLAANRRSARDSNSSERGRRTHSCPRAAGPSSAV
jgi:hypothetical protein